MTAEIVRLDTAEEAHDAYVAAARAFRADPRAERIAPVMDAFRRFHRVAFPQFDTEAAAREVRRLMWKEIAKRQGRGDAA